MICLDIYFRPSKSSDLDQNESTQLKKQPESIQAPNELDKEAALKLKSGQTPELADD